MRGNEAKEYVIKKIQDAFGEDFVGAFDKKVYLWSKEDGQKTQVCLSLTCPKTLVGGETIPFPALGGGLDFEAMDNMPTSHTAPAEISAAEQANIEELMKKLGL